MTEDDFIDAAERRRKRREREILLLLLLITDHATRDAINSYRHGNDWQTVLRNRIMGRPEARMKGMIPAATGYLVSTHYAGAYLASDYLGISGTPPLAPTYEPDAQAFAQKLYDAVVKAFGIGALSGTDIRSSVKGIRTQLETDGYTKSNPYGIALGVERQVVTAFNNGIADASLRSDKVTAFEHITILDGRETDICHQRSRLRLSIFDPYWLTNWVSLHWGCRSIILPLVGVTDFSTEYPTIPPMEGFGQMPPSIVALIRANRAA